MGMARLINYFELKQRILEERNQIPSKSNVHNDAMRCGIRKALRCLERCQSVTDMVEVVRCKDCAYYQETIGKDSGKPCGYGSCINTCAIITGIVYDEDFCSYGERKDE